MNGQTKDTRRQVEIRSFVRETFGIWGTLRIHKSAFGADLLRAPLNVLLAPILILSRLMALLTRTLRLHRTSNWFAGRKVLLETTVSKQVAARVRRFIEALDAKGLGVDVSDDVLHREIAEYTGVRSAVGEITTTILVVFIGFVVFHTVTPGLISLAGPVAEMRAHNAAVENFPLGQRLGRAYYGIFSTKLEVWQVVITGAALAMIASVVTTFAGVIADPLQVLAGTHKRRLLRLMKRLEDQDAHGGGLACEHVTARFADLSDMALNVWRLIRG